MKLAFTVVLQPEEEGSFSVSTPSLVGCSTQSDTFEDAIDNARDAIEGHVASLIAHGYEAPIDIAPGIAVSLEIDVPAAAAATAA